MICAYDTELGKISGNRITKIVILIIINLGRLGKNTKEQNH